MSWTKTAIYKELKDILTEYPAGVKFYFQDREIKKLHGMLKQLDKYKNSLAFSNHYKITWRTTGGRRYKCLNIVLNNGKLIPVTKAAIQRIGTKGPSKRAMVIAELRRVIEPQIQNLKQKQLRHLRIYKKSWVDSRDMHLDHKVPFIKLAVDWVIEEGYSSFDGLPGRRTYGNRWKFPPELEQSWYQYHERHAELELVEAHVNLSESAKGYVPPF